MKRLVAITLLTVVSQLWVFTPAYAHHAEADEMIRRKVPGMISGAVASSEAYMRKLIEQKTQRRNYPVVFVFQFENQRQNVSLIYDSSMEAPRRKEVVLLQFEYFGKPRRISASVDFIIYEYYQANTLQNIDTDGYIVNAYLEDVKEQPTLKDLENQMRDQIILDTRPKKK